MEHTLATFVVYGAFIDVIPRVSLWAKLTGISIDHHLFFSDHNAAWEHLNAGQMCTFRGFSAPIPIQIGIKQEYFIWPPFQSVYEPHNSDSEKASISIPKLDRSIMVFLYADDMIILSTMVAYIVQRNYWISATPKQK